MIIPLYEEDGIKLCDAIPTYGGELIITEKLKSVFEKQSGANFEYYPVKIKDKKGRVFEESYYLAHLLDIHDCLDLDKSLYRMDAIIKNEIDRFAQIVLDENKLNPEKKMFRIKHKPSMILVTEDLVDEILDVAKCYGPAFEYVEDHGEIYRENFKEYRESGRERHQVYKDEHG